MDGRTQARAVDLRDYFGRPSVTGITRTARACSGRQSLQFLIVPLAVYVQR